MITGDLGTKLIEHFEGKYTIPYLCSSNYVTGGIGHIIIDPLTNKKLKGKEGLKRGLELYPSIPDKQIYKWLKEDLRTSENEVNRLIKVDIKQNQFDALSSHVFNCGVSQTLFSLINAYPPYIKSIREFWLNHYITSLGVKSNGLIRRRRSEYELFLNGKLNFFENG